MRIVSWNLGHQTQERRLPVSFIGAVKALKPDVLVLNEYVHGKTRTKMLEDLHSIGLTTHNVSKHIPGQNQVLIASRSPQSPGDLQGPTSTPGAISNFLHVTVSGIEIVGMRAPAYETSALRQAYWNEIEQLIQGTKKRRIVFIGDMNCDPDQPRKPGGHVLDRLREAEWQIPKPKGEWSYTSKNGKAKGCIDHAICSSKFQMPPAVYVTRIDDLILAGSSADKAMSDHAALVLEIDA